jgi:predicted nucleic acid-binding protein
MTILTVVFDTNILFSGTGWRGSPFYCLKLVRDGMVNLVICREILEEYHEKLQTKLDMSESKQYALLLKSFPSQFLLKSRTLCMS